MPDSWPRDLNVYLMDHERGQIINMHEQSWYDFNHEPEDEMVPFTRYDNVLGTGANGSFQNGELPDTGINYEGRSNGHLTENIAGAGVSAPQGRRAAVRSESASAVRPAAQNRSGANDQRSRSAERSSATRRPGLVYGLPGRVVFSGVKTELPATALPQSGLDIHSNAGSSGREEASHGDDMGAPELMGGESTMNSGPGKDGVSLQTDGLPRFTIVIGPEEVTSYLPIEVQLMQNYPNPFNPSTNIRFALPDAGNVRLEVYDILGRRVAMLANTTFEAGTHEIRWDAGRQASGVYLYRLTTDTQAITRKMTLVK